MKFSVHIPADSYVADLRGGATLDEIAAKHGKSNGSVIRNALARRGLPTSFIAIQKQEAASIASTRNAPGKVFIPLTRGKVAVIDAADAKLVAGWSWHASCQGERREHWYASGSRSVSGRREAAFLHRLLLGAEEGQYVDHIDGDGLNNCRANLRICTHAENMQNAKIRRDNFLGVKNVTPVYRGGKLTAYQTIVRANGLRVCRSFKTLEAAAAAAAQMRSELQGEFASDRKGGPA